MDAVLEGLVRRFQGDKNLSPNLPLPAIFETFAAYCTVGQHYEDTFKPDDLRTGGPRDLSIDAVAVIINNEMFTEPAEVAEVVANAKEIDVTFVVIQAKISESFVPQVFTQISENLHNIFRREPITFNASDNVKRFRDCVDTIYLDKTKLVKQLPRLSVYYVTGARLPMPTAMLPRADAAIERLSPLKRFETISFRAVGADELQELYRRTAESVTAHLPMPHKIEIPKIPSVENAFLGVVRAKDLVDHVLSDPAGNIRFALFNENVRAFLGYGETDESGVGNSVNAGIRQTLRTSASGAFSILNNGLTILVRKAKEIDDSIYLEDIHIANGCQTCYVLFDERDRLGDNVFVTARIIETTSEELTSGVVTASNRQNVVTPDDLAAREKLHRDLEEFFANQRPATFGGQPPVDRRLYYERRTGQYPSPSVQGTRIIRKRQLVQAYASMFLDEAHRATRVSEITVARGKSLFNPGDSLLPYYVAASSLYVFEWLLRNKRIPGQLGPAKYHMIAATRLLIIGPEAFAMSGKSMTSNCNKMLDQLWDPSKSETLGNTVAAAIWSALGKEDSATRIGDAVRTSRFKLNVVQGILDIREGHGA